MTAPTATAHAEALAHATAELIRFGREGPSTDRHPFVLDDITAALAEALHFALTIETEALRTHGDGLTLDLEEIDRNAQLAAALSKWLSDNGFDLPGEG